MKNRLLLIISMLFVAVSATLSQTIEVRGIVKDNITGEELIGAAIVDGSNAKIGTVTDVDGKYTIKVTSDATLKVSYIGYLPQEIKVGGRNEIDVLLKPEEQSLETVVVVGVAMKKSDLTGAVGSISGEKLQELPVTSVNEALQGRVAGVFVNRDPTPGGGASIKVRGNNSIAFGQNPIYIVDGLVMEDGFNMISPEDIASIEVLKDASATSLYGSRAANGVVVISTKRGERGGKISYDAWFGFSNFLNKMSLMNTTQLRDLRLDAYANVPGNLAEFGLTREEYIEYMMLPDNYGVFSRYEKETLSNHKSYNWLDEVSKNGFEQNHSLSFSDADDKGAYYLSFNYVNQEGLIVNSDYERFNFKVNMERSIRPWLKIGTNTSYVRGTKGEVKGEVFWNAFFASPFLEPQEDLHRIGWQDDMSAGAFNPLQMAKIDGKTRENRTMSTNFININPIKGLNIRNSVSIDYRDWQQYWYTPKGIGQSGVDGVDGMASHRKDHWMNWQYDGSISYETTINEKHRIFGTIAANVSKNKYERNQIGVNGIPDDRLSYYELAAGANKDKADYNSLFNQSSLAAFVQRFNYTYDNKYFATITMRQEGSSKISPENRWSNFPSFSVAWDASKEEFINKDYFFDQLKLRLGYGVVGNQGVPLYAIYSLYNSKVTGTPPNTSVTYPSDGRLGNPNLKWEKQKQFNIGLDIAILKNRLSLTADYYHITNSDLLMQRSLQTITGYTNTITNVGELENKGMEFTLNGTIVDSQDFKWHASANISFNKNKIKKLFADVDVIWKKGGWTNSDIEREGNLFVGESLNSIYTYKFDRIIQESDMDYVNSLDLQGRVLEPGDILPLDLNGDKIINDKDKAVVGNTDPKYWGGFSTDMSYKGFGLNVVFNYSVGAKKLSGLYESLMSGNGVSAAHTDLLNRWTPESPSSKIPRAYRDAGDKFSYGATDLSLQNASYLRMGAITLSYDFSKSLINKIKMENVKIYFTGNNLWTVTGFKGFDPEVGDWYPPSKMYVLGIKVGF